MAGTTVDNLNVLDTSSTDNIGGTEIITWSEVQKALFGTTNATQTTTIQNDFFSGNLQLTFAGLNGLNYAISYAPGASKPYQITTIDPTGQTAPVTNSYSTQLAFITAMNA